MSMIGCFYAVADKDLDVIVSSPKRISCLWAKPQPAKPPTFIARLFGAKAQPTPQEEWRPSEEPIYFDVDKAWHGIHFLLTGSSWEGTGPLAFILHGGREIDEDLGYGPPHGFTSAEVKEIDAALSKVDPDALCEKADPAAFTANEIYPEIWGQEPKAECIGYIRDNLINLKKFVSETAQAKRALIAYLG